jgi:hypothetical protein
MSDLSPEARALIDAALECDEPSLADRERVATRIGEQLGVAALATTGAASAAGQFRTNTTGNGFSDAPLGGVAGTHSSAAIGVAKIIASAALVGALSATAVWAFRNASAATKPAKAHVSGQTSTISPSADVAAQPTQTAAASDGPSTEPSATLELTSARETSTSKATHSELKARKVAAPPKEMAAAAAVQAQANSLQAELALVGEAQRALHAGSTSIALAKVNEHLLAFPNGALREEALAVAAIAKCKLGEPHARALREFEQSAPGSILLARVRAACNEQVN